MGSSNGIASSDPNSGKHLNEHNISIINLPVLKVLRVASRSFFLTFILLAWPSIGFFTNILVSSSVSSQNATVSDPIHLELLPLIFRSVASEGLIKSKNNRVLVVGEFEGDVSGLIDDNDVDVVVDSDLKLQSSIPDEFFDFAFASNFKSCKFIDRVTKNGGILVFQLGNDALGGFKELGNYKIVFVQQLNSIPLVTMRRINTLGRFLRPSRIKKHCGGLSNVKRDSLYLLEDPLLEPPRWDSSSSGVHFYKINFLSDLLGNVLHDSARLVFLNVGSPGEGRDIGIEWFLHNYPRSGLDFEVYDVKTAAGLVGVGVLDWLSENVKEDDFVVLKADAGVVEEMLEGSSICLVDELFLKCERETGKSRRGYWECLSVYGRLKDAGVAVHQWWG